MRANQNIPLTSIPPQEMHPMLRKKIDLGSAEEALLFSQGETFRPQRGRNHHRAFQLLKIKKSLVTWCQHSGLVVYRQCDRSVHVAVLNINLSKQKLASLDCEAVKSLVQPLLIMLPMIYLFLWLPLISTWLKRYHLMTQIWKYPHFW